MLFKEGTEIHVPISIIMCVFIYTVYCLFKYHHKQAMCECTLIITATRRLYCPLAVTDTSCNAEQI